MFPCGEHVRNARVGEYRDASDDEYHGQDAAPHSAALAAGLPAPSAVAFDGFTGLAGLTCHVRAAGRTRRTAAFAGAFVRPAVP